MYQSLYGEPDSFGTQRALARLHSYEDADSRQAVADDEQRSACRAAVSAIKSIPGWAKTEVAYAHLLAVISAEIASSGWGHTDQAERVCNELNDLHDDLDPPKKKAQPEDLVDRFYRAEGQTL